MAKYDIKFMCGHEETRKLFGKMSERERKIEWMESNCVCSECYKAMQDEKLEETHEELRIKYFDYKNDSRYKGLKSKKDSYDGNDKTVIVYVPKDAEV